MADPYQAYLAALDVLYVKQEQSQVQGANTWLTHFQRQPHAWSVCDQLLRQPNMPQSFMMSASFILRSKILFDFRDLPNATARQGFRDSLMGHIMRYCTSAPKVSDTLCICMAALCIHLAVRCCGFFLLKIFQCLIRLDRVSESGTMVSNKSHQHYSPRTQRWSIDPLGFASWRQSLMKLRIRDY